MPEEKLAPLHTHSPGETLRFEADPRIERRDACLRAALAIAVLLGGGWLLTLPFDMPFKLIGVAAILFAVRWLSRALHALRIPHGELPDMLELTPQTLRLRDGGVETELAWAAIAAVRLDEDRLLIVLDLESGEELSIEPRYPGIGLRDLGEAIEGARRACDG